MRGRPIFPMFFIVVVNPSIFWIKIDFKKITYKFGILCDMWEGIILQGILRLFCWTSFEIQSFDEHYSRPDIYYIQCFLQIILYIIGYRPDFIRVKVSKRPEYTIKIKYLWRIGILFLEINKLLARN